MKKKLFWFSLLGVLLSTGFLYTIGNIFDISLLSWKFHKEDPSDWVLFEAEFSIIPIIIGIITGFITEYIIRYKQKNNSNLV